MLLRQTLLYLPAQIVGPLAQFFAAVVWTYFLTPAALGTTAIVFAVQELVLLVTLSWWSGYTLRYFSGHDAASRRAHDGLEVTLHGAAALLQVALVTLALWLVLDEPPTPGLVAAALAYALTRNLTSYWIDRCVASFATRTYSLLQVFGPVFGLALGILFVRWSPTPEAVLWGYTAAQAAGIAIAALSRPLSTVRPALPPAILGAAWRYGTPLLLGNLMSWVGVHGIRLIVEYRLGPHAVGLVSVGWWLGLRATSFAAQLFLVATFNVAVEKVRRHGAKAALDQIATNGALLLAVVVPTVAGVFLLNRPIVEVLVAEPFRAATTDILPWAVAAGGVRVFRMHGTDQTFLLFEKPVYDTLIGTLDAVTTLLFCAIGLQLGGLHGAVVGCFAGTVVTAAAAFALAKRRFGYFLRWGDLARLALATAAMAAVLAAVPTGGSRLGLAAEVAAGAAVYGAVLLLLYPALFRDLLRWRSAPRLRPTVPDATP